MLIIFRAYASKRNQQTGSPKDNEYDFNDRHLANLDVYLVIEYLKAHSMNALTCTHYLRLVCETWKNAARTNGLKTIGILRVPIRRNRSKV